MKKLCLIILLFFLVSCGGKSATKGLCIEKSLDISLSALKGLASLVNPYYTGKCRAAFIECASKGMQVCEKFEECRKEWSIVDTQFKRMYNHIILGYISLAQLDNEKACKALNKSRTILKNLMVMLDKKGIVKVK